MKDFGSSGEDSQVSQSEPEIVANTFITTNVNTEVCSTDDDDKFSPLQELTLETPATSPTKVPSVLQKTEEDWDALMDEIDGFGSLPKTT